MQIALFVISCAGFGQRISWKDEGRRPEGYELSFKVRCLPPTLASLEGISVFANSLMRSGNDVSCVHRYNHQSGCA